MASLSGGVALVTGGGRGIPIAMCVGDESRFVTAAYIPVNGGMAME